MSITVRLGKKLEHFIEEESKNEGITKSQLVRECIAEYYNKVKTGKSPWELGNNYFDLYGSGSSDLSVNRKKILRNKIHGKKNNN